MFSAITEFVSTKRGDSDEFIEKVRAIAIGVAKDREPARLYLIRIDNWFGPKWMHFTGKALGLIGVHALRPLHVPPFVPHRVVEEQVFAGPDFAEMVVRPPLHIECASSRALQRRIADIDNEAAFVWYSGESESQKRGAVMVYRPSDSDPEARDVIRDTGAFYVGYSCGETKWEPVLMRGVSRGEIEHLEESWRTSAECQLLLKTPSAALAAPGAPAPGSSRRLYTFRRAGR